jgi:hypothetical protein
LFSVFPERVASIRKLLLKEHDYNKQTYYPYQANNSSGYSSELVQDKFAISSG